MNGEVAYKYKMSTLQAALGTAQLERLDELVGHRRMLFAAYREGLAGLEGITLNAEPAGVFNSYWMITARCTRRLVARPSAVMLSAIGRSSP